MKKLICAAAMSALCATVFAIESENIVGYQQIEIPKGWSLYTVTFKDVGGDDYNVQNIIPYIGATQVTGMNQVSFQKCDTAGYYGTTYGWIPARGGWCQGITLVSNVKLADGEAVCFNSKLEGVKLQVSGAVEIKPVSITLAKGFNLVGNMTPVELNLQDIKPYVGDSQLTGMNQATLQKCGTDGSYGTSYGWIPARGGWCQGINPVSNVTLQPGEAFCINVKVDGVKLQFKSPVSND